MAAVCRKHVEKLIGAVRSFVSFVVESGAAACRYCRGPAEACCCPSAPAELKRRADSPATLSGLGGLHVGIGSSEQLIAPAGNTLFNCGDNGPLLEYRPLAIALGMGLQTVAHMANVDEPTLEQIMVDDELPGGAGRE